MRPQSTRVALRAVSCSSTPHDYPTEDASIPWGISAHPVIRTRQDLKGTKKTRILISAALNTFMHQRKITQKCFNLSYILKIPFLKKFHVLQQIWLYFYTFIAKWFPFCGLFPGI